MKKFNIRQEGNVLRFTDKYIRIKNDRVSCQCLHGKCLKVDCLKVDINHQRKEKPKARKGKVVNK